MVDRTNAERQARFKRHRRGDHSMCEVGEGRCAVITNDPDHPDHPDNRPPAVPDDFTEGLGEAGRRLWDGVTDYDRLTAMQQSLLREACRTVDRLDRLNSVLAGEGLLELVLDEEAGHVAVVQVKGPLSEARQQAATLKTLFAELRMSGVTGGLAHEKPRRGRPPKDKTEPAPAAPIQGGAPDASAGNNVTDMAARVAAIRGKKAANRGNP